MRNDFIAMKTVDDMLTGMWLNALLTSNGFTDKFIFEMDHVAHSEWKAYLARMLGE